MLSFTSFHLILFSIALAAVMLVMVIASLVFVGALVNAFSPRQPMTKFHFWTKGKVEKFRQYLFENF